MKLGLSASIQSCRVSAGFPKRSLRTANCQHGSQSLHPRRLKPPKRGHNEAHHPSPGSPYASIPPTYHRSMPRVRCLRLGSDIVPNDQQQHHRRRQHNGHVNRPLHVCRQRQCYTDEYLSRVHPLQLQHESGHHGPAGLVQYVQCGSPVRRSAGCCVLGGSASQLPALRIGYPRQGQRDADRWLWTDGVDELGQRVGSRIALILSRWFCVSDLAAVRWPLKLQRQCRSPTRCCHSRLRACFQS